MSRFSVVIPTYNRADFLPDTLNSIFEQSFTPHEVVVVDDGSTDGTREFLAKLAAEHDSLKVIHQQNTERGAARNRGIEACTGDYIVLFDSDDMMSPGYLENINEFTSSHPYADIIAGRIMLKRNGQLTLHRPLRKLDGNIDLADLLRGNPFACHFTLRRSEDFIPFNEARSIATAEDWLFLVENVLDGKSLHLADRGSVIMTKHDQQSMANSGQAIDARSTANDILQESSGLTGKQKSIMDAYTHQFKAIHLCDQDEYRAAWESCVKAIKMGALDLTTFYTAFRIIRGIWN